MYEMLKGLGLTGMLICKRRRDSDVISYAFPHEAIGNWLRKNIDLSHIDLRL